LNSKTVQVRRRASTEHHKEVETGRAFDQNNFLGLKTSAAEKKIAYEVLENVKDWQNVATA
jgi:hypothetical protein